VLKQVHPDTGISKKGISIMNLLINNIFECIAMEAGKLAPYNKKATLSSHEIHAIFSNHYVYTPKKGTQTDRKDIMPVMCVCKSCAIVK
jgi:hypothetical protein